MPERRRDDAGETLIELLVTIVILGVAAVAIVAAIGTAISASVYHRRQADTDIVVKDYAEALRLAVSQRTGASWCSGTPDVTYAPAYTKPSDWSGAVTSAVVTSCPLLTANVPQFQTLKITAKTSDNKATETQTIVVAPNWCWNATCP